REHMGYRRKPTVVDLFAGAGLLSRAFGVEGFHVVEAIEKDRWASETYARNVGTHIRLADIQRLQPHGTCDVLVSGPPCQGFSTLGKRDHNDPRNFLSLYVVKWARRMEPKVVVIENVAAFLNAPIWAYLARLFERMGYIVTAGVYDALQFGSPQIRL